MRQVEWIESNGMLGATASNPKQYADCNIAAPSEAGKEIIRRLQSFLQTQVPNSDVKVTGFLDQQTCRAWRASPTGVMLEQTFGLPYPANFNITNILDTIDGRTGDTHHWSCNGSMVVPDCSQVPMRVDTPASGKKKSKKSNLGLLLLGGAAAASIAYAMS